MFGILNVNKPPGWTSRDAVNRVQRLVRPAKAGHAGTLDPLAAGVLVVCVGPATKLISYVQEMPKTYRATFLLGRTSPSDDVETEIEELAEAPKPTRAEIEARLPQFVGSIQQRPPAYSAVKIKGRRAYQLARAGEEFEIKPKTVIIYDLVVDRFDYPALELTMRCGSGTYVRSLGRDLAESLGTGAVMSALERTAIGDFRLPDAVDTEQLTAETLAANLRPPLSAVAALPRLEMSDAQWGELKHGRRIAVGETGVTPAAPDEVFAAVDSRGDLVALVRERHPGMFGSVCNFQERR